jgi:hypothetical protein
MVELGAREIIYEEEPKRSGLKNVSIGVGPCRKVERLHRSGLKQKKAKKPY